MKKVVYSSLAFFWILYCIVGMITNAHKYGFFDWIVVLCVMLFPFGVAYLIKRNKRKATDQTHEVLPETSESKADAYIQSNNVTYRTDGKPISDEEVPYLIQAGLENVLRREQESNNPKFHRTFREQDLSFEFSMKYSDEADKRTDKFETLYRTALQEKNLSKRIELLNNAVIAFEKAKNFCYAKGKGGTIYFQDTWEYMHNSERPCYSYLDKIQDELKEALQERDVFIPSIIDTISSNNGLLQKNIYDLLPEIPKPVTQRIIRNLEMENKLERIKKSGSYELHIIK